MLRQEQPKERCDAGFGVNSTGEAVYLDFSSAIIRYGKEKALVMGIQNPSDEKIKELGEEVVSQKYGNLFQMYEQIVDENPYKTPNDDISCCSLYNGWCLGRL